MAYANSPVTGVIDEKMVIVDSGQYQGKTIFDLQELDPDYYQSLAKGRDTGGFSIRRHKDKSFRLHIHYPGQPSSLSQWSP